MATFYVTLWDFELEDSGEIVKNGLVFSSLKAAEDEFSNALLSNLDSDFASRAKSRECRRLHACGYVVGNIAITRIDAQSLEAALADALAGKGEEIRD